jgi:hypothetical protein
MMPRVDLPEVLLEVDAWTGYLGEFTHTAMSGSATGSRMRDLSTSMAAVLIAQGCNLGFAPIVKPGHPALTRDRLSHPVWIWEDHVCYYGFPFFGESTVKAARDVSNVMIDVDQRSFVHSTPRLAELSAFIRDTIPGAGQPLRTITCQYALTPDRHFVLGALPEHPRLLVGLRAGPSNLRRPSAECCPNSPRPVGRKRISLSSDPTGPRCWCRWPGALEVDDRAAARGAFQGMSSLIVTTGDGALDVGAVRTGSCASGALPRRRRVKHRHVQEEGVCSLCVLAPVGIVTGAAGSLR